jgi:hypothetical protein
MTHSGHCSPTKEERIEKYLARFIPGEKVEPSIMAKDLNIHVRTLTSCFRMNDQVQKVGGPHGEWVRV